MFAGLVGLITFLAGAYSLIVTPNDSNSEYFSDTLVQKAEEHPSSSQALLLCHRSSLHIMMN